MTPPDERSEIVIRHADYARLAQDFGEIRKMGSDTIISGLAWVKVGADETVMVNIVSDPIYSLVSDPIYSRWNETVHFSGILRQHA
jgi:hypothetical protein